MYVDSLDFTPRSFFASVFAGIMSSFSFQTPHAPALTADG
jgi:hypothetical protein